MEQNFSMEIANKSSTSMFATRRTTCCPESLKWLGSIGGQTVERQDSKHPSEQEGYTTESSCARYNGMNSWYFNLLAVHCFGLRHFHKAAVLVRYLTPNFHFKQQVSFLRKYFVSAFFKLPFKFFLPFFPLWIILSKKGGFTFSF